MPFDGTKRIVDRGPELPLYPFASAQPVAVLPAVRSLVSAHQCRGFLGYGPHLGGAAARTVAPHVQNRAHVKRAYGCVRIPGAVGAVLGEHLAQRLGVFGQMLKRNRAVFYET